MTAAPANRNSGCGDGHVFLVEGADAGDSLLRLLGLVAVQQARVSGLSFACAAGRFHARLELQGLQTPRAEHLRRRMAQLPVVDSVSFGRAG